MSNDPPPAAESPNYDRTAWFYELTANLYSLGQIPKAKRSQVKFLEPGDKVLYLGVGAGEDAIEAARQGMQVTCLDLSSRMLSRFQRKLEKAGLQAELVCGDAFEHDRIGHYDAVMTNFFLNVFPKPLMAKMLCHAATLVRPGGKFMIADCAIPHGGVLSRAFNRFYLRIGMGWYWLLGLAAWHKTYDYRLQFERAGLETETVELFRFLGFGPALFWNIVATKSAEPATT